MSAGPADYLKRLAPGYARGSTAPLPTAASSTTARRAQLGQASFADLLKQAASGELESSLPVAIDRGINLELSADQQRRLNLAADRAEASGFSKAVVHLDGHSLVLDVEARRVTGLLSKKAPTVGEIDGVVVAPPPEADALADAATDAATPFYTDPNNPNRTVIGPAPKAAATQAQMSSASLLKSLAAAAPKPTAAS